jgi:hypothetical protein
MQKLCLSTQYQARLVNPQFDHSKGEFTESQRHAQLVNLHQK